MMKQDKLFSQFYTFDKSTNCYMVEIALDQYTDIFNEWDPTPFKRREIDPDLRLYLEGSCEEIPRRYPIEICFLVPGKIRDELMEEESRLGLKNYFRFKIYFLKKDLRKIYIQMLNYSFIGFLFLWVGTRFSGDGQESIWLTILIEGIFIWGWVLLWEAASLFFFRNRELYDRYQIYQRLMNAPVIFVEVDR